MHQIICLVKLNEENRYGYVFRFPESDVQIIKKWPTIHVNCV